MKWPELADTKEGLLFLALCKGVVGIRVPDTKHLAMRRMICNMEELISNERGNLEREGRELVKQEWWKFSPCKNRQPME